MTVDRLILLDLNHHVNRRPFFNSVHHGPKVGINSTFQSIEEFDVVRRYNPNWIEEKIWIPAGSLNRASQLPHVPSNGCQIIYGPNIHVEDMANKPYLDHKEVTFLVPCDWVVNATEKYLPRANIVVFPYGIGNQSIKDAWCDYLSKNLTLLTKGVSIEQVFYSFTKERNLQESPSLHAEGLISVNGSYTSF